jgi:competence protein ComEA
MFSGLTRQEQRILLILIGVIALGLAIDYYKTSRRDHALWVEVPLQKPAEASARREQAGEGISSAQPPEVQRQPERAQQLADTATQRGKIDINRATAEQLQAISGVNQQAARDIIAFRDKRGGFRSAEELLQLTSVDQAVLTGVLRAVYVSAAAPTSALTPPARPPSPATAGQVNINTATLEELKSLDLIGEVLAKRIIDYRTQNGPFRKPEDIMNVRGIGKARWETNKHRIVVK